MSGSGRAIFALKEETELKNAFLKYIRAFEAKKLPKDIEFAEADKNLNTVYAVIMKKPKIDDYSTITKDGIKATQLKWIAYRDAWVKSVEIKYPDHPSDGWKTWLTKQRIEQVNWFAAKNPA